MKRITEDLHLVRGQETACTAGTEKFELDRTATNLIKLEHLKIPGKQSPKVYDLWGMVEVDQT